MRCLTGFPKVDSVPSVQSQDAPSHGGFSDLRSGGFERRTTEAEVHDPLPKKWFEIWYEDTEYPHPLMSTVLVSETHESAQLAALQRIPMKHLVRTVDRGEVH